MTLRLATAADLPRLRTLYDASARAAGPQAYSDAQIEAWVRFARVPGFEPFVLDAWTLVAEREGVLLGFGGLDQKSATLGRIASLYTDAGAQRQGVGTRLLVALLAEADRRGIVRLTSEASVFSRSLFARHGFVLEEIEFVERRGATFKRYVMRRGHPKA